MQEKTQYFEDFLQNATQCLEKLDDKEIGLQESLKLYKEGMENLQKAQKLLEEAQVQYEELKMQYNKDEA